MGRRGRKRQLEVEAEYWQLLKAGVGTVAACRLVGITRKTGYRWRAENGGIPPVRLAGGGPYGPVPVAAGAPADRDLARPRAWRAGDRPAPGSVAVNGQPGAAPQPAPARQRRLRR
jgi:hypothetical protein